MNTMTIPELMLRHVIGLDQLSRFAEVQQTNYPPHNIEQNGSEGEEYILTLAVAGFSRDELNATIHNNVLSITGRKNDTHDGVQHVYTHRGIAFRDFERQFTLADFVQVETVTLENGLLTLFLKRHIPDAAKPKQLAIS
jgi:molecular chaperone IbpA